MAKFYTSKYSNVNYASLKSEVDSSLRELVAIESNLKNLQNNLANGIPSTISVNIANHFNSLSQKSSGVGSVVTLKKRLNTLKTVAGWIEKLQKLEKEYQGLKKEIDEEKAKKNTFDYDRNRYNLLVLKINGKLNDISKMEAKIDQALK